MTTHIVCVIWLKVRQVGLRLSSPFDCLEFNGDGSGMIIGQAVLELVVWRPC